MLGFFFTYPFSLCRLLTNLLFSWHTSDQNRSPALTQSTATEESKVALSVEKWFFLYFLFIFLILNAIDFFKFFPGISIRCPTLLFTIFGEAAEPLPATAPKNGGKRRTILSTIHLEGSSDRSLLSKLKTILPQKEMSTGRD
ncbi:hypothetical protein NC652_016416 [Populus alba x Populus x berolinensis]|nr:hypothetical protein NC652_016416 [Populus alba x Populus x berolinensis]